MLLICISSSALLLSERFRDNTRRGIPVEKTPIPKTKAVIYVISYYCPTG